ncbi:hypothetical protein EV702DRAFT_1196833 [Suillus placidus]|uniref:Uncharacterized protein n=1 Tax=Suillus placidus TaxID=48579 RepID=A0A9P6ZVK4_9AGAM|nr:hypothetical protein EV702DRAFT_1196833 [Suillus placidus]
MFTALCHDFVLRQNIHVASSCENKSDFLSSTYGSRHVHLVDGIVRLFNSLQCEGKSASSTHPLPELMQLSSKEHFGLVESTFASTFGGLLDIKTEDSESGDTDPCTNFLDEITNDNHTETILQLARSEIINELDIDPQLLSMPQPSTGSCELPASIEPLERAKPVKCKADDNVIISESEPEDSGQPRAAACEPPCKIMWHMMAATSPEVAALQGISPITLDHFLKPRSRLPYCKAPSRWPTDTDGSTQCQLPAVTPSSTPPNPVAGTIALAPILRPPGMTLSQQSSCSGSETFWRRHCHAIELIKAEPGLGKKICKAHTCSRCKTIMYPSPENSGYNHRRGFCANSAKQVSKIELPPPWPQPPGIFSEGKHFHPRAFLKTV